MEYRLHIDIPMGSDEDIAVVQTKRLIKSLFSGKQEEVMHTHLLTQVNYRLGCDEDRQKSNYLDRNENGHVSNKKTRINFFKYYGKNGPLPPP